MVRVQYAKILPYAPTTVWALLADPSSWPAWNEAVSSVEVAGEIVPGAQFRIGLRRGPLSKYLATITELTPGRRLQFSGGAGGFHCECTIDIIPLESQTKLQITLAYSGAMMWMNEIFGPPRSIEHLALQWVESCEQALARSTSPV